MKKLVSMCAGAALCILASCSEGPTKQMPYNQGINVIPVPVSLTQNEGVFKVGKNMAFQASTPEAKTVAEFFASKMNLATGYQVTVGDKEVSNGISLLIDESLDVNNEGYILDVTANGVVVKAKTPQGLFYGMQTFMQLLPAEIESPVVVNGIAWTTPCVSVKDEPRFGYRGFMLDPCRHFIPVENVKKQIDVLSLFKVNRMHWHLTDDQGWRIEIKKYPKLTEVGAKRIEGEGTEYGGFYTQEEIKEVVKYAADRFITVIPELELPGHEMAAIAGYPELSCKGEPGTPRIIWGVEDIVMCAGKEETFKFLEDVIDEIAPLFPSEYFHIGGDECFKGFWHKCPRCQVRMKAENLKNEEELQSYFIHRMGDLLKSKGKKLVGWDEILEGGLAPDANVMSWRGMEGGIKAAKAGHHVIMTPTEHCYLDLWQGEPSVEPDTYSMCRLKDSYSFNPVPEGVPAEMVLGGQGNLWAESLPTFRHVEYMTWPRGWALSEVLWSGPSKTDWEKFWPRVEKHFVRADQADINYARSMYNAIVSPYLQDGVLQVELGSEIAGTDIYYTFDNTDPDSHTPKYTEPLSIPKNATWLRIVTYRDGKPVGKVITLTTKELAKRAESDKRTGHGNLTVD